jgi:hypothetical protein
VKMFGVIEETNIPAGGAEALPQWRKPLHDGATAGSQQAADAIVQQIRSDLAAARQQGGGGGKSGGGGSSGGSPSASPT